MTWHIVSDSSCDLTPQSEPMDGVRFSTVPFTISIGDKEYVDDGSMDIDAMLTDNERNAEQARTSCPSPHEWLRCFEGDEAVLAFTISSELSGSYNSACTARNMLLERQPHRQIAVIDTRSTGPEMVLLIRRARALIRSGAAFDEIVRRLEETAARTHIVFALASYHNLMKAGRVNKLIGLLAGHLGIWGIGAGDDSGRIVIRAKVHGPKRMMHAISEEIRRFGIANQAIVICHCLNEEIAQRLKDLLAEVFAGVRIDILPTRGLTSFYAERRGLIIAY